MFCLSLSHIDRGIGQEFIQYDIQFDIQFSGTRCPISLIEGEGRSKLARVLLLLSLIGLIRWLKPTNHFSAASTVTVLLHRSSSFTITTKSAFVA